MIDCRVYNGAQTGSEHACTNANGQPRTGARFPTGSPQLPIVLIPRWSRVFYAFSSGINAATFPVLTRLFIHLPPGWQKKLVCWKYRPTSAFPIEKPVWGEFNFVFCLNYKFLRMHNRYRTIWVSDFLVTETREAMVAFAIDRQFYRPVMKECHPILRTFGIGDSPVSLTEKTSTREGFPIKPSHNKPRSGLSPHSQNNVAFTRFHVHRHRLNFIHWSGFSYLNDCLNSRSRRWIACTSVYLGLHQFSPHMDCSMAWLYSSINQNLHGGGMMRISCVRMH